VVHHGLAPATVEKRHTVPDAAYLAHPERFVRKPPKPPEVPKEVWINKPTETQENETQ
jgi:putative transposase